MSLAHPGLPGVTQQVAEEGREESGSAGEDGGEGERADGEAVPLQPEKQSGGGGDGCSQGQREGARR